MEKFTSHLKDVLGRAQALAALNSRAEISAADLIFSLASEKGSLAREILLRSGFSPMETKELETDVIFNEEKVVFEKELSSVLAQTVVWAAEYESSYVGTEHLLCALIAGGSGSVRRFLSQNKVKIEQLADNLKTALLSDSLAPEMARASELNRGEFSEALDNFLDEIEHDSTNSEPLEKKGFGAGFKEALGGRKKDKKSVLDFYARNLTDAKIQSEIDPVVGRGKEIERIIQILTRRTKNNPVLLGDAGVGKTAIVEGLAKKIMEGDVPDVLINKKIYALDVNMLIAGTVMRGEFEGRLKNVLEEVKNNKNIILFIDEIHMIVGAGAVNGALDAGNILKPALARGEIRCLGATTFEDYKKYIEEDAALERRFQAVNVPEPSVEETLEILNGVKTNYEKHHQVKITPSAVKAAVELSVKYIPEKFLPDKAIDLIDEASARLKVKKSNSPLNRQIRLAEERLKDLEEKKVAAIRAENFEEALNWRSEEEKTTEKIKFLKKDAENSPAGWLGEISEADIAAVVSEMKQIPLSELNSGGNKDLVNLEKKLSRSIFGQNEALKDISFFIKRSRAGLAPESRPLGSFIFLGPSGVGKTETAKVLAEIVFGSPSRLVKIDMSEFAESFNASRLIGSPPGYVGFKEGGRLTEAVRRQPYSVVLFDEMEKAHPQIFNLLLQILEEGKLTDATGKVVNFKNTIIIMTANVGLREFQKNSFGFDNSSAKKEKNNELKEKALSALNKEFRPELLNRVDKIIVFHSLTEKDVVEIVASELEKISVRLLEKKIKLSWNKTVLSALAKKSFSPESGAREVRRVLQREVEEPIIEMILSGRAEKEKEVKMSAKGEKIIIK